MILLNANLVKVRQFLVDQLQVWVFLIMHRY